MPVKTVSYPFLPQRSPRPNIAKSLTSTDAASSTTALLARRLEEECVRLKQQPTSPFKKLLTVSPSSESRGAFAVLRAVSQSFYTVMLACNMTSLQCIVAQHVKLNKFRQILEGVIACRPYWSPDFA